jgi:hypothetical protein
MAQVKVSIGNPIEITVVTGDSIKVVANVTNTSTQGGVYVPITAQMRLSVMYGDKLLPGIADQNVFLPANSSREVTWIFTFPVDALISLGVIECLAIVDGIVVAAATLEFALASMSQRLYPVSEGNTIIYQGSTMGCADALASIIAYVLVVWYYDVATQTWKGYDPKAPSWVNDLNTLVTGEQYVIHVSQECSWTQKAKQRLYAGSQGNWAAYRGYTMPASQALASILSQIDIVWYWDHTSQIWKAYRPAGSSDFTTLVNGESYYVLAKQDCDWQYVVLVQPSRSFRQRVYYYESVPNRLVYRGATMTPGDALAPIISKVISAWYFDNVAKAWKGYNPTVPLWANDLKSLQTGEPYSIFVNQDCEWIYQAIV